MNNLIISVIRTIAPMVAGWIITVLALPETVNEQISGAFFVIASGLYYVIARWLEEKWPQLGWLLGYTAEPEYERAETIYDIADDLEGDELEEEYDV